MQRNSIYRIFLLLCLLGLPLSATADAILKVTEFFEENLTSETLEWVEIQNTGDMAYSNILFMVDQNIFDSGTENDREQVFTGNDDEIFVIDPGEVIIVLSDTLFDAPTAIDNFHDFWFGGTNSGLQFGYLDFGPPLDALAESVYFYDNDTNPDKNSFIASGGFNSAVSGAATNGTYALIPFSTLLEPSLLSDDVSFLSTELNNNSGSGFNLVGSPGLVAMVPEPSALALLTLAGVFMLRRRRQLKRGMSSFST